MQPENDIITIQIKLVFIYINAESAIDGKYMRKKFIVVETGINKRIQLFLSCTTSLD